MKTVIFFSFFVAVISAECDVSKYKKIGCFQIEDEVRPDSFHEVIDLDETFDIDNYEEQLPKLVCECFSKTKDDYKYFSIGHNGHCHGGKSFHASNRTNNEAGCIDVGHHSAGDEEHEYVYQIKADAATPIDGGVSDFGPWSQCSKSCGGGRKSRERACVDPIPNDPGKGCENLTQVEECNTQNCPINGAWGGWSEFSQCSKSCGMGSQSRSRKCNSPKEQFGGKKCVGKHTETQSCMPQMCVKGKSDVRICEDKAETLSCPANWSVQIQSGSYYGRKNTSVCKRFYNINWSTTCEANGGKDKMAELCDGKRSCSIDCNNDRFGDPCWGTKKYCLVKYKCVGYDL
eukprot:TCONS_00071884-protein